MKQVEAARFYGLFHERIGELHTAQEAARELEVFLSEKSPSSKDRAVIESALSCCDKAYDILINSNEYKAFLTYLDVLSDILQAVTGPVDNEQ